MIERAILIDLLMATMDSISTWSMAVGDRERGLAWRDRVTERMIAAGRYEPYESLVEHAAADLGLPEDAYRRLRSAWSEMRPWPDVAAVATVHVPYGFVTNCSIALAAEAVERSGLHPAFVLSAEEAGWYKPRPEIYRQATDRLGAAPDEVRFIAGAPYDAIGATAVGLHAVLVARRPLERELPSSVTRVTSLTAALSGSDQRSVPAGE